MNSDKNKTVTILGGSGLIGSAISQFLTSQGFEIFILSRRPKNSHTIVYQNLEDQNVLDLLQKTDVIINLAGETIAQRWTKSAKEKIFNSRVKVTEQLIQALQKINKRPALLINTSATGFYGDQGDRLVDESVEAGDDFLSQTAKQWELTAMQGFDLGMRVVTPRFGVVLASNGGFLSKLLLPFKLFVGAILGSGQNYLPWIHIEDLTRIILFLIENRDIEGAVNVVSPQAVTVTEFSHTLAKGLHRPCLFKVPSLLLKIFLGEMSVLMLASCKVFPEKLMTAGFQFEYSDLDKALKALLQK